MASPPTLASAPLPLPEWLCQLPLCPHRCQSAHLLPRSMRHQWDPPRALLTSNSQPEGWLPGQAAEHSACSPVMLSLSVLFQSPHCHCSSMSDLGALGHGGLGPSEKAEGVLLWWGPGDPRKPLAPLISQGGGRSPGRPASGCPGLRWVGSMDHAA